jgi:uncharacterized protein YukE
MFTDQTSIAITGISITVLFIICVILYIFYKKSDIDVSNTLNDMTKKINYSQNYTYEYDKEQEANLNNVEENMHLIEAKVKTLESSIKKGSDAFNHEIKTLNDRLHDNINELNMKDDIIKGSIDELDKKKFENTNHFIKKDAELNNQIQTLNSNTDKLNIEHGNSLSAFKGKVTQINNQVDSVNTGIESKGTFFNTKLTDMEKALHDISSTLQNKDNSMNTALSKTEKNIQDFENGFKLQNTNMSSELGKLKDENLHLSALNNKFSSVKTGKINIGNGGYFMTTDDSNTFHINSDHNNIFKLNNDKTIVFNGKLVSSDDSLFNHGVTVAGDTKFSKEINTRGTIKVETKDMGAFIESNSVNGRAGIGQFENGITRIYSNDGSSVNLSIAGVNNGFDDVVSVKNKNTIMNGNVNLNGNLCVGNTCMTPQQIQKVTSGYQTIVDNGSLKAGRNLTNLPNNYKPGLHSQNIYSEGYFGTGQKGINNSLISNIGDASFMGSVMIGQSATFDNQLMAKNKLCIDDVCVDKTVMKKLLDKGKEVNCQVSDWTNWSSCSRECDGGEQTRTRSIIVSPANGGLACPNLTDKRECNNQPCPVDCKLSDWSEWTACSKLCGGGEQTRTRSVLVNPANGGKSCEPLSEKRSCNTQPCPVDCQLSNWSDWSACTTSCGGGTQSRTRSVLVNPANGGKSCDILKEDRACNTHSCKVDCQVGNWSGWSICSKSCGGGTQTRYRNITVHPANGGASCPNLSESQYCNIEACPVDCQVGNWSGWTSCSNSCGSGTQKRYRSITVNPANGGASCPNLEDAQYCTNYNGCPPPPPPPPPPAPKVEYNFSKCCDWVNYYLDKGWSYTSNSFGECKDGPYFAHPNRPPQCSTCNRIKCCSMINLFKSNGWDYNSKTLDGCQGCPEVMYPNTIGC